MNTFNIESDGHPSDDVNIFCPFIKRNCCSYRAQHMIYQNYIVNGLQKRIKRIYDAFELSYDRALNKMGLVEIQARRVLQLQRVNSFNSTCYRMAKMINKISLSRQRRAIMKEFLTYSNFMKAFRDGFYCSLCDMHAMRFYKDQGEAIQYSPKFCATMIN